MPHSLLTLLAVALYLAAALLLCRAVCRVDDGRRGRNGIFVLVTGALVLHAALLHAQLFQGQLDLGFTNALSLVAWVVAMLFLIAALTQPVEMLGLIILPVAAAALGAQALWHGPSLIVTASSNLQGWHVVVSLLAYSLLAVAAVQALVLAVQERALHRHATGGFLRALPALDTMESLLFRLIFAGFLLLTLTLVSGVFFSEALFGRAFRLTHHVVLSVAGWVVFGALLAGRLRYGWRGRTAVKFTLAGFVLLLLGYFGSKFVLEVLLRR